MYKLNVSLIVATGKTMKRVNLLTAYDYENTSVEAHHNLMQQAGAFLAQNSTLDKAMIDIRIISETHYNVRECLEAHGEYLSKTL